MTRFWMTLASFWLLGCQNAPSTQPPSTANEPPRTVEVPEPDAEQSTNSEAAASASASPASEKRTTSSGLGIEVLRVGSGAVAEPGHELSLHYVGTLTDGSVFDSSRARNTPFNFPLGKGHVIKGFEEGVTGMRVGEIRRLTIPPELGYGDKSPGKIPPRSTLIFEIELLGVK
jgi:FKBP-type peptidyl-prolyl cis-trans isomerase